MTKINAAGSALVYSTYLGGSSSDLAFGIAVDAAGNAYVTGQSPSTNFPVTDSFQTNNSGGEDAFISKIGNYSISGRVIDLGGIGITGVELALSGPKSRVVNSDGQGYFAFENATVTGPGANYNVVLAKAGMAFIPNIENITNFSRNIELVFIGYSGTPSAGSGMVGGNIIDNNGLPVAGTVLRLSGTQSGEAIADSSGNYNFLDVPTNGFYTVTPSRANYSFNPASRSFSSLAARTEASFTAVPNGDHTNAIDTTEFFVRQQYLDFLGREPDPPGFKGWITTMENCLEGDPSCDRIHVSEAFFKSPEFQQRGYFIYRFYSTSFGRKPDYAEFKPDLALVSGFLTDFQLEAVKVAFVSDFMSRPAFANRYNSLNNEAYVDALTSTAGVTLQNRQALIDSLNNGTATRAQVLRQIAESVEVYQRYYNQAFVVMEYFGYLRRDPDAAYTVWIDVLNANPADSRHMVEGFIDSLEYRNRFAQ